MKKYFLLFLLTIVALSCNKTIEVKGTITGGSPLERIEVIETSGAATLPLLNVGLDPKGNFQGAFEADKHGLYVLTYAGRNMMVYLEPGQKLELKASSANFPEDVQFIGDAKNNNDFMKSAQLAFETYASKINMEQLLGKKEDAFIKEFNAITEQTDKIYEENAKKYNPSSKALKYKKRETQARLMGLVDGYEQMHGQITTNPQFKVSQNFKDFRDNMMKDNDEMIRDFPMYREYQLNKLNGDFQKYMSSQPQAKEQPLISKLFGEYLKTRKDLSQTAKDYFFAYIISQSDLNFMNSERYDEVTAQIEKHVSNASIKSDLKHLQKVLMGEKAGTQFSLDVLNVKNEKIELGKKADRPTLIVFYASWNPNVALTALPQLKDFTSKAGDKLQYTFINLDDTKEQFNKTSTALFQGISGTHYWLEGGINSKRAGELGLYGFKLPSYLLLDKEGKLVARPFYNLNDPEFATAVEKVSGVTLPQQPVMMPPQDSMEVPADSLSK